MELETEHKQENGKMTDFETTLECIHAPKSDGFINVGRGTFSCYEQGQMVCR
jgi:hypothetical protein